MYCCLELCRAWGCLPGSLHCTILESIGLTVTQNNAGVAQQSVSIRVAHNHISQASRWSIREFDWAVTSRLTPPKNCAKFAKLACSVDCGNYVDMPDRHSLPLSPSKNCTFFPSSHPISGSAAHPENCTFFMSSLPATEHPAQLRNCDGMFSMRDSQQFRSIF